MILDALGKCPVVANSFSHFSVASIEGHLRDVSAALDVRKNIRMKFMENMPTHVCGSNLLMLPLYLYVLYVPLSAQGPPQLFKIMVRMWPAEKAQATGKMYNIIKNSAKSKKYTTKAKKATPLCANPCSLGGSGPGG
jgi:hypothetical protein